jgi:ATP-dependent Clp protease protease subunit
MMNFSFQWQTLRKVVFFGILLSSLVNLSAYGKSDSRLSRSQPNQDHFVLTQNAEEEPDETVVEQGLLNERIIFLSGEITAETASAIVSQLLYLDAKNPDEDIYLYINSPGGSVYAGLAIYDAIQYVQADVATISVGLSASMAAFLLAAGTPGKRSAFPHSRVMIHQISSFVRGNPADIEIEARETAYLENKLNRLFALHTNQPIEKIRRDIERDYYMSATEALDYGIIDRIVEQEPVSEN